MRAPPDRKDEGRLAASPHRDRTLADQDTRSGGQWGKVPRAALDLRPAACRLFIAMSIRADGVERRCWASQQTLCEDLGLVSKTVDLPDGRKRGNRAHLRRLLDQLIEAGMIREAGQMVHHDPTTDRFKWTRCFLVAPFPDADAASTATSPVAAVLATSAPHPMPRVSTPDAASFDTPDAAITATQSDPRSDPEESDLKPLREIARRDLLFEAVAEACGWDWHELTPSGRGSLNRAVAEIRGAGGSPANVGVRARNWPFPATLTPTSLAKHWASLATPPRRGGNGKGSNDEIKRMIAQERAKEARK